MKTIIGTKNFSTKTQVKTHFSPRRNNHEYRSSEHEAFSISFTLGKMCLRTDVFTSLTAYIVSLQLFIK